MPSVSTTTLLTALRQYGLLEPKQLAEVLQSLALRFPESKDLARELIRRDWLTSFQANQLLLGRGQDLVLGKYILLERVGEGGMGQVFKARHRLMGRTVAIKLIRQERLDSPEAIKRFEREVRAAAVLDHPNIVHALDADRVGGNHLLVMEYIDGASDLAKLVKKNGPLPVTLASEYLRQAALGLQHAHERGMVHRDIKPHNLLLTADGAVVKILDMGLARLSRSDAETHTSNLTQEGKVMGTPDYLAPEQALAAHTVDIRADLYSLGCTFYYLLSGRLPFKSDNLTGALLKHQLEQAVPVEQLRPEVPPELAAIIRKLMAKRPEDRFQTPAELVCALSPPKQTTVDTPSQPTPATSTTLAAPGNRTESTFDFTDVDAVHAGARQDTAARTSWLSQWWGQQSKHRRALWIGLPIAVSLALTVLIVVACYPRSSKPATSGGKRPHAMEPLKEEWVQLFNGKDLTGWHQFPAGGPPTWSVKDGILKSASKVLFSNREDYENFQLRIEARLSAGAIGGLVFRSHALKRGWPGGFYVLSAVGPGNGTGSLFMIVEQADNALRMVPPETREGEWFTQQVSAVDRHITVDVNGKRVVEYEAALDQPTRGPVALHLQRGMLEFRKVEIKELRRNMKP
jgi:serine/threonine-protein kinase